MGTSPAKEIPGRSAGEEVGFRSGGPCRERLRPANLAWSDALSLFGFARFDRERQQVRRGDRMIQICRLEKQNTADPTSTGVRHTGHSHPFRNTGTLSE